MNDNLHTQVILVDQNDNQTGTIDKLAAHEQGLLHRAFSVLIFNSSGEILLQQRAMHKYHSRGLWTNTVCSHPKIDEPVDLACHRRLLEEMNFDCTIQKTTVLHYQTPPLDTGLIENEMLHLFVGMTDQQDFNPNPEEVMAWRWISAKDLKTEVSQNPEEFSFWFRLYMDRFDLNELFALSKQPN
jgi:isopentenyl-diphosphate delta-isomerase